MSYISIPFDGGTEMVYREWVDDGKLENPEPQSTLEKLKQILESKEI
ncbi:hypothetical protein FWF74_01935 [Candidatus Saccharibacteria bacterium]|nr:hypothetical protein [Candidatus Saccharibacteria bacterium]